MSTVAKRLLLKASRQGDSPLWGMEGTLDGLPIKLEQEPGSEDEACKALVRVDCPGVPGRVLWDFEALMRLQPSLEGASADTAGKLVRALGKAGDERAEPLLAQLLGHAEAEVRRITALSLGRVGSVRAVEALLAAQAKGPAAVTEAARDAVRRIQARLGDAEAGGLSVSPLEGAEAGLSLAAPAVAKQEKE